MTRTRLPRQTLIAYALPWFAVQVVQLPLVNFVPGYYSSDLGMPLLTISWVMLATRFVDIFTDPLIGWLSDRTKTPIGRRRPWVLLGAPILIAGGWLMFNPPDRPDALYLFMAVTVGYLGFTLIQIPYVSWGAELSPDYDERNAIVGWREGVGVFGTLTAVSAPLIAMALGYPGLGPAMFAIAVGLTIVLPLLLIPAMTLVPEPAHPPHAGPPLTFRTGLAALHANKPFAAFIVACFVLFIGVAPGGAVGYLMMKHTFDAEALYPILVFSEFVAMLISVPVWAWAASRIGKHRAMALALVWMVIFTASVPLLGLQDPLFAVISNAVRGLGFGAVFVIPYSLLADVIDQDTLKTGRARSGLYIALAGMALKFSLMFGVFIATAFPTLFGFEPSRPQNTPLGEFSVAISYAWVSCVFWLAAAWLFWKFPLSRAQQEETRQALEARAAG
jgi:Na+/melibiose symporter-like transporter